jgi:hypothetical protein
MHRVRRKVEALRPGDRAVIDQNGCKQGFVLQRGKYARRR